MAANVNQTGETSSRNLGAMLLIGIGGLILLTRVLGFDIWNLIGTVWPMFLIIPAGVMFAVGMTGDQKRAGLLIPAMVIGGTGAMLLAQSLTDRWESWAYAWALYPAFVGFGLTMKSRRTGSEKERKQGRGLITWGVTVFVGFMLFFELFIFGSVGGFSALLASAALIGAGVLMMRRNSSATPTEKRKIAPSPVVDELPAKPKRDEFSPAVDADLQRQIDAALNDDDIV